MWARWVTCITVTPPVLFHNPDRLCTLSGLSTLRRGVEFVGNVCNCYLFRHCISLYQLCTLSMKSTPFLYIPSHTRSITNFFIPLIPPCSRKPPPLCLPGCVLFLHMILSGSECSCRKISNGNVSPPGLFFRELHGRQIVR